MSIKFLVIGLSVVFFVAIVIFSVLIKNDQSPDRVAEISAVGADSIQETLQKKDLSVDEESAPAEQDLDVGLSVTESNQEEVSEPEAKEPEVKEPEAKEPVVFAPDFTLRTLDDTATYVLSSFAGDKPVVVDFFAEHCPNCRRNLPKIEALHTKYEGQVEVVLIGIDSKSATQRYFKNNPTDLTVVMANNRVLSDYGIRLTNTKALINRDGSLLEIVEFRDILEEDFLRLIES